MRKLLLITTLLFLTSVAINYVMAGEEILYSKVKTIQPEKTDGQYCFIKALGL